MATSTKAKMHTPKTIATINFKGGVGKTTVTWCLGDIISTYDTQNTIIFDLDAQMSLTQAITLNEDGSLFRKFSDWSNKSRKKKQTIFNAIEEYTGNAGFNFQVDFDFIYKITDRYHFIPAVEDLYWLELDVFDRARMKGFIRDLLGRMRWTGRIPSYNFALFDCPPSFTLLSYSVLSCCDLILIPVNPDFYAVKGVPYAGSMTKESFFYWDQVKSVCKQVSEEKGIRIKCLETPIYDRVAIKRAITQQSGVPRAFVPDFVKLWHAAKGFLYA